MPSPSKTLAALAALSTFPIVAGCFGGGGVQINNRSPRIFSLSVNGELVGNGKVAANLLHQGEPAIFNCATDDPDRDAITVLWTFAKAPTRSRQEESPSPSPPPAPAQPEISRIWTPDAAGTFVVVCTVQDDRGGIIDHRITVEVKEN